MFPCQLFLKKSSLTRHKKLVKIYFDEYVLELPLIPLKDPIYFFHLVHISIYACQSPVDNDDHDYYGTSQDTSAVTTDDNGVISVSNYVNDDDFGGEASGQVNTVVVISPTDHVKTNRLILPAAPVTASTSAHSSAAVTTATNSSYSTETLTTQSNEDGIILCGVCSNAFASTDECNKHIMEVILTAITAFKELFNVIIFVTECRNIFAVIINMNFNF